MIAIFDQLPICDLIGLGRVCKRLKPHIQAACRLRRKLYLEFQKRDNHYYDHLPQIPFFTDPEFDLTDAKTRRINKWTSLEYARLNEQTVQELAQAFPVITELTFEASRLLLDQIPLLTYLLERWSPNLVSLQMDFTISDENYSALIRARELDLGLVPELVAFISQLNSMPALKRLAWAHNWYHYFELPILGQLERFTYAPYFPCLDEICRNLNRYGATNQRLRQVELGIFTDQPCRHQLRNGLVSLELAQLLPALPERITMLRIRTPEHVSLVQHFTSLTYLQLLNVHPFDKLIRYLEHLHQLHYLHFGGFIYSIFKQNHGIPYPFPSEPFPQLASVKVLTLSIVLQDHNELDHFQLGNTFPSLQTFDLWNDHSFTCEICDANGEDSNKCVNQLLDRLNTCMQLRKIRLARVVGSGRFISNWPIADEVKAQLVPY